MADERIKERITTQAAAVLLPTLPMIPDSGVLQVYDAYASQISYHHADDSGREWGLVAQYRPGLDAAKAELDRRGIAVPKGYLL